MDLQIATERINSRLYTFVEHEGTNSTGNELQ
jgi:hypothetical protein